MRTLCLCLACALALPLLLAGCTPASVQPEATPPVQTPGESGTVSPEPTPGTASPALTPGTASPTPTAPTATPQVSPSVTPGQDRSLPLLSHLAEGLIDTNLGLSGFKKEPDAAFVDKLFYLVLRDAALPDLTGVSRQAGSALLTREGAGNLYAALFSEGKFTALPEDGLAKAEGNGYRYTLGDPTELQYSVEKRGVKQLEQGYEEWTVAIYWAYPEDAQATEAGEMTVWVKPDPAAYYGCRLGMVKAGSLNRPGDEFGSHPQRDVEKVMPVLHAVGLACLNTGMEGFNEAKPSDELAWSAACALIGIYGESFDPSITVNGSGSFVVPKAAMLRAFNSLFAKAYDQVPAIASRVKDKVSKEGDHYVVKKDDSGTTPVYADFLLGERAALLFTVSLRTGDKTVGESFLGSVCVHLVSDPSAAYGYNAYSAIFTPELRSE